MSRSRCIRNLIAHRARCGVEIGAAGQSGVFMNRNIRTGTLFLAAIAILGAASFVLNRKANVLTGTGTNQN